MEPFEWLVLGIGVAIGALFGARGKTVVRSTAKGFMALEEKTRELTANVREDFRDAVEEARYEHRREAVLDNGAELRPAIAEAPQGAPTRRRAAQPGSSRSTTGERPAGAKPRGRPKSTKASDGAPRESPATGE
jgi:hypothetical protein